MDGVGGGVAASLDFVDAGQVVDGVSGAFAEAFEAVSAEFEDAVGGDGFDFVGEA